MARIINLLDQGLREFRIRSTGLSLREKVALLVDLYHDVKDLGVNVVREHGFDVSSARERIRLYLLEHVLVPLRGDELEVVAGVSEYGRRVRELRVEEGYHIASGATPDPETEVNLKPDEYMLMNAEPDKSAARRWHIANRIRRQPGSASKRLLMYLIENVGSVVTTEELAYVSRDKREFARRVRELRTEDGYAVATRFTGRPDLGSGQYVLESEKRIAEPHDRQIPDKVSKQVYARDGNMCRSCGWTRDKLRKDDPRILELHHRLAHAEGGANSPENLLVLCSRCHDAHHAGKLGLPSEDS